MWKVVGTVINISDEVNKFSFVVNCNPFEIKESSGKGLGLFATCDLNIGDLIVRENPILYFEGGSIGIINNPETFKEAFEALGREKNIFITGYKTSS